MNNIFKKVETSLASFAPRTRFDLSKHHLTSVNASRLYPIWCEEVLPGDTWQMDLHSLVRMQTPIRPIMDDIFGNYYFFFVPYRLLDENFEKVITISDWNGSIGTSLSTFTINANSSGNIFPNSLLHYLGLPIGKYTQKWSKKLITAPFDATVMIWNEYFRDENYQTKVSSEHVVDGVSPEVLSDSWLTSATASFLAPPPPVNEFHDLFTSVLPSPQKGDSVMLPLGEYAPVGFLSNGFYQPSGELVIGTPTGTSFTDGFNQAYRMDPDTGLVDQTGGSEYRLAYADLSKATAATINQLREAVVMQHFLETLARTGSRYTEYLKGFWGVNAPDARLQRPEFIAEWKTNINVNEVIQHAGLDEASGTTLGSTGAVSRTGTSANGLFTYSSSEHGFIMGFFVVRHKLSYSQGISNMWFRTKGTDFYNPVFNGLGETPIYKRNVLAPVAFNSNFMKDEFQNAGSNISLDDILGFNEAWSDYKFRYNQTSGLLNPVSKTGLDFWTLTKAFTTQNITGADIRVSSEAFLDRALAVTDEDQFICDFYFDVKCTRRMPLRSTPGVNRI